MENAVRRIGERLTSVEIKSNDSVFLLFGGVIVKAAFDSVTEASTTAGTIGQSGCFHAYTCTLRSSMLAVGF